MVVPIAPHRGFAKLPHDSMRTLICLTLLATILKAQVPFHDEDFVFTVGLPEGMVALNEQELRGFLQIPDEYEINPPLTDDVTTDLVHSYYWRDTAGKNREISLVVAYSPRGLPWVRPEDFEEAMIGNGQLTIDRKEPLKPPHPGFMLEGTSPRPDGVVLHRLIAYFTLGQNKYAILNLSSLDSRWAEVQGELAGAIDSVRFPMPEGAPGGKAAGNNPAGPRAPQGSQASPDSSGPRENWSSLEVTGSLVLAMLLMMGLFAGGKRPS